MCVKFSTTVSSQQRNAVTFHPGKEGWSETGFQKKQMRALQTSHTHAHVHTQHATATTGKHNNPALAQSTGGCNKVQ